MLHRPFIQEATMQWLVIFVLGMIIGTNLGAIFMAILQVNKGEDGPGDVRGHRPQQQSVLERPWTS